MPTDFLTLYEDRYAPLLGLRTDGFRVIFDLLEQRRLARGHDHRPWIIETGSLRTLDNWEGDGQSTRLFDAYAGHVNGAVVTIDIDPAAQRLVQTACSPRVEAHAADSVATLHALSRQAGGRTVDLLYLDSFDYDVHNPFPSAFHHVKELISAMPLLGDGTLVAVDDNFFMDGAGKIGKGVLVRNWFDDLGLAPVHDGYQIVWVYRR